MNSFEYLDTEYGVFKVFKVYEGEVFPIFNDWRDHWSTVIPNLVTNRKCVVQAGGHQGVYPVLLSRIFDEVWTFEPEENNFTCLVENCVTYNANNVNKFQTALGTYPKMLNFQFTESSGQHRINHDGLIDHLDEGQFVHPENVRITPKPSISIDSLELNSCDLIFLDVEGYEPYVLIGSLRTIEKFKPAIIIEQYIRKQHHTESIVNFLTTFYGYQISEDFKVPNHVILKHGEGNE